MKETVTVWPCSAVVVPRMVWPASCSALLTISSSATVLMVTVGATVSTVKVCVVWPLLPALSLTEAVTVSAPWLRAARSAAGTSSVQVPSLPTSAV